MISSKKFIDSNFSGDWRSPSPHDFGFIPKIEVSSSAVLKIRDIVSLRVMIWNRTINTTYWNTSFDELEEILNQIIRISSPYIVQYKCYFEVSDNLHVVSEFCGEKNLDELLEERKKIGFGFQTDMLKKMIGQLTAGFFILNKDANKIPHCKLKSQNVVILNDDLKIDFGVCAFVEHKSIACLKEDENEFVAPERRVIKEKDKGCCYASTLEDDVFMAPEIKQAKEQCGHNFFPEEMKADLTSPLKCPVCSLIFTKKSDMFSLGVIFKHIVTVKGLLGIDDSSIPSDLRTIIQAMISEDPKTRPDVPALIKNDYVRNALCAIPVDDALLKVLEATSCASNSGRASAGSLLVRKKYL